MSLPWTSSHPFRAVTGILLLLISLHYYFSMKVPTRRNVSNVPPISNDQLRLTAPSAIPSQPRANATLFILCRNRDLGALLTTMQQLEDRFNGRYGYPWVFLNDEPFTEEFKRRVSRMTDAPVAFGAIPSETWEQPRWINASLAESVRKSMALSRVPHGESLSWRNMNRFNAGFLFNHDLLKNYRYYWRIEPGVKYFCDVVDDPFSFMENSQKTYGFTIANRGVQQAVYTLWEAVYDFTQENSHLIPQDNLLKFVSDDAGDSYNLCQYWNNFEIADMDFWRSAAYTQFFEYLDRKGGIYYERWSASAIQSIALSLFARKSQIHFFDNIGYRYEPFQHCPQGEAWARGRCWCDPGDNFDTHEKSCLAHWKSL